MFNSYVELPEGNQEEWLHIWSRNWMATEIFDHQACLDEEKLTQAAQKMQSLLKLLKYHLVMTNIAMENHHF